MLWEAIKLANQSVRRNVLRSILTLLGIVIGVSAVIAMVTIGNGTTQKVTEDLSKLGSNMLVARPGRDTFGAGSGADVRSFTERNVATLRSELADVRGIAPTATRAARVVYGAENYDTTVTGTESDFFVVQDWTFESGRPFTDGDIRSASSVCVIGQTVKTVLFGQADPLGLAPAPRGPVLRSHWRSQRQGAIGLWLGPGQHGSHAAAHFSTAHRGKPAHLHDLHSGGIHRFHPHRTGGGRRHPARAAPGGSGRGK